MTNTKFSFIDFEKIKEEKKKQLSLDVSVFDRQLSSIIAGLDSIEEDMKINHLPKISESAFKKHFLKAFAGIGDKDEIIATYNTWLSDVAKSPGIPVNVCEDSDEDKILFTVPSIGNSGTINPEKTNSNEVYKAISLANDARFLRPFDWEQILANNLDSVLFKLYDKSKVSNSEESNKWLFIFAKYKDILLPATNNNRTNTIIMTIIGVEETVSLASQKRPLNSGLFYRDENIS
jgi:hypothetical protein